MNTLHGCPFLRKQFYAWVENNLSHLVLSWWSKETAMMINFVLKFSSQAFLAHKLIDLHKYSHFQLWFHFFRTSFDFKSLNCKKISHFLSSHHQCVFQFGVWRNMIHEQLETPCNLEHIHVSHLVHAGPVFLYKIIQQFLLSNSMASLWQLNFTFTI